MKHFLGLTILFGTTLFAAEPIAPAPIVQLNLFKNGLAAVTRQVTPAPGPFLIDETLEPLHGTLWFSPADALTVQRVRRALPIDNEMPFADPVRTFKNQSLTLTLYANGAQQQPESYSGIVIDPIPVKADSRQDGYITLKLYSGELVSFPISRIATIRTNAIPQQITVEKPVWLFQPRTRIGGPFHIYYLTRGITWAPAYKLSIGSESQMQIAFSAVISNELSDLKNVATNLVSGYPNIRCESIISPMSTRFSLNEFFQQMGTGNGRRNLGGMMMQKSMMYNAAPMAEMATDAVSALPSSGQSEDIQLTPIGGLTLKKGDAAYLPLASATGSYERLVEWTIPDRRNIWGRWEERGEDAAGILWDAVRFRNPFQTAMTTAPIEIVDGDKVLGQAESSWVNPGETTVVKITKALTVTGKNVEYELHDKNKEVYSSSKMGRNQETVYIAGYNYRTTKIQGEISLKNYRKTSAKVLLQLEFSGKLEKADASPALQYLERGVYSVNPRGQLKWELELKPNQDLKLNYQYSVLIRL